MERILYLVILIGLLALVSYQDFKDRAIDWFLPILLTIVASLIHYQALSVFHWPYILSNLTIVLIQLFVLFIYFSIKERRLVNIVNQQLGLGDILFFIPLALLFSPIHFVLFFVGSLCITLLIILLLWLTQKVDYNNIPLAAAMSLNLALWLVLSFSFDINLYDDYY